MFLLLTLAGLSDHQTELISIAAGLTKFDENYLPIEENAAGGEGGEASLLDDSGSQQLEELAMSQGMALFLYAKQKVWIF